MREHRAFSHRDAPLVTRRCTARDDLFRSRYTFMNSGEDQLFAVHRWASIRDFREDWRSLVHVAEQDGEFRPAPSCAQRRKVVAHVPLGRIDQHGSITHDVVAGNQRAGAFVIEAEVATRIPGVCRARNLIAGSPSNGQHFVVIDKAIDRKLVL